MKKNKRRCFTLLETMIALALLSVLITFLLGFYWEIESIHSELIKQRRENFRLLYVQNRLKSVLSNTSFASQNQSPLVGKKKYIFFVSQDSTSAFKENSLVLIYNNGVADPAFSQDILGRLYLDREGRFCLARWPQPKMWMAQGHQLEFSPINREVLMENVETLTFEFYMPPDKTKDHSIVVTKVTQGNEETSPYLGAWQKEWPITHTTIPAMVKVTVEQKMLGGNGHSQKHQFVVPLNAFSQPVLYKE